MGISRDLSRRGFVTGAGALAAGSVGVVSGCSVKSPGQAGGSSGSSGQRR